MKEIPDHNSVQWDPVKIYKMKSKGKSLKCNTCYIIIFSEEESSRRIERRRCYQDDDVVQMEVVAPFLSATWKNRISRNRHR